MSVNAPKSLSDALHVHSMEREATDFLHSRNLQDYEPQVPLDNAGSRKIIAASRNSALAWWQEQGPVRGLYLTTVLCVEHDRLWGVGNTRSLGKQAWSSAKPQRVTSVLVQKSRFRGTSFWSSVESAPGHKVRALEVHDVE